MIETFKILNGYHDTKVSMILTKDTQTRTRGNQMKLFLERANTETRRNFFSLRVVAIWNSLPDSVILAPSINSFKNRIDRFWSDKNVRFDYEAAI